MKAWKEYIREKTPSGGGGGGGGNRGGNRGRPFQRAPVIEYECPPREESYRNPSETQCDKCVTFCRLDVFYSLFVFLWGKNNLSQNAPQKDI